MILYYCQYLFISFIIIIKIRKYLFLLRIVWTDDKCSPKYGTHMTMRWYRDEDIDVLLGTGCSAGRGTCFYLYIYIFFVFSHLQGTPLFFQTRYGAFHIVCTHLGGGEGEVKPPIHSHCVFHAKRGWVGPDSMYNCVRTKWKAPI